MKKIEDLKQGDRIYDVKAYSIQWFSYLCVHPNAKNYHILIDSCEEPIRVYKDTLQNILDKNLSSYDEAKIMLAEKFEDRAKTLREKF